MTNKTQQAELEQLRNYMTARRTEGKRSCYPAEIRQQVCRLQASGVRLAVFEKLGLPPSMIYKWKKKTPLTIPAAKVIQVTADPARSLERSLLSDGTNRPSSVDDSSVQLRVGSFAITIKLAGH